ncbi:MAG: 50S ribosomal protein L4 [Puniceicoccales bacterium]|jgi:large subunit ribosomal protein L4|nr:50S ribosomal protein L4 [Puniceicoccales bacterium]
MDVEVFSSNGAPCGRRNVCLPSCELNGAAALLRSVVLSYQNNFRSGSANTKSRAEVRGSGRKPYRQKGTGMARHGERRSPIWRGGGVVFGPRSRVYCDKVNVKTKRKALALSLAVRVAEGNFSLLEDFPVFAKPHTKSGMALLRKIGAVDVATVLVSDSFDRQFALSMRNIPNVYMVESRTLNALDVIAVEKVFVTVSAIARIRDRIGLGVEEV